MPKAMLTAMIALACLVVMPGCHNRQVDDPPARQKAVHRSTTIWAPASTPTKPQPVPPETNTPEPAMSIPPAEEAPDRAPAVRPSQPEAPARTPSNYTDACGRPLIT